MAIQIDNTNAGILTLKPGASGTYALTFPTAAPASSGLVLSSDTSGNLSWVVAATGSFNLGTTSIAFNRASAAQSLTGITIDGGSGALRQTDATAFLTVTDPRPVSGARGTDLAPNAYANGLFSEFKNSSLYTGVTGNYSGLLTYANWSGTTASTGDPSYSLLFSPQAANSVLPPRLQLRAGIDTTWGKWSDILHSGNHIATTGAWTPNVTGGVRGYANGSFRKDSGNTNTWDGQVYSTETFSTRVFCAARAGETNTNIMWGLNSDPTTNADFSSIDYAWYFNAGTYGIYESNAAVSGITGAYTVNDFFAITYDGSYIRYWLNDTMIRSIARSVSGTLAFDSSFYQVGAAGTGASLQAVSFGSLTHSPYNTIANFRQNSLTLGAAIVDPVANAGQLTLSNGALATTLNAISNPHISIRSTQSNSSFLEISAVRDSAGTDWTTAGTRIQMKIDSTFMAYQQFNGTNANYGIEWGTGNNASATSISARMRLDSAGSLRVLSNVTSTTTTSGSVIVTGGVGVSENMYVGGYSQHVSLARTNARFASAELTPTGHYTPGETVFEIDPTWSLAELQKFFNTTGVTWLADTTSPAGYAIQMDGAINFGSRAYGSGFPMIPVETNDIYYMEFWLRNDAAYVGPGHYAGGVSMDAAGTVLPGNPGSYDYFVMSNTTASTTWTKYSGYITGFAAASSPAGTWPTNTKYWSPLMLANYSFTSGTRRSYLSGWRVYKVYQTGRRKFADMVTYSTAGALTAAGATQGTALALTSDINNVTTVAAGTGVILPFWQTGHRIVVRNGGANNLAVYPNSSAQINSLGANVAFSLPAGTAIEFVNFTSTQWNTLATTYA